jgi:hypothetical protein
MAPPYLGRGIRTADPFGRRYGIGKVTVVIGVVAVTEVGTVTVAEVMGVLTVTVAATVAGRVGIVTLGRATAATWSIEVDGADMGAAAVDAGTDPGVVYPLEPCVDTWTALVVE